MITGNLNLAGKTYQLDEHGFLDPPEQWDEAFAEGLAPLLGIFDGLTEEHWRMLRFLRNRFIEEAEVPVVAVACAELGMRIGRLKYLFPHGYHRGACRLAGINHRFMYEHNIWLTYENYSTLHSEYPLSPLGFLLRSDAWNERFARLVAHGWSLPEGLGPLHWQVIRYLRAYHGFHHNIPTVMETCRACGLGLSEFAALFPDGYRRGACRAAGLPFNL